MQRQRQLLSLTLDQQMIMSLIIVLTGYLLTTLLSFVHYLSSLVHIADIVHVTYCPASRP